jgi:hypothetical protein
MVFADMTFLLETVLVFFNKSTMSKNKSASATESSGRAYFGRQTSQKKHAKWLFFARP